MDKKDFLEGIIEEFREEIMKKLLDIPENWDGLELRQYCSDYFEEHFNYRKLDKKRKEEYENDRLINNL